MTADNTNLRAEQAREAFEAFAHSKGWFVAQITEGVDATEFECYSNEWETWQAALASRASPAAPDAMREALAGLVAMIDSTTMGHEKELRDEWLPKARAALAAPPAAGAWQPMNTAPSNCTLLGSVAGVVRLIRWGKTSHVPMYGWCLADQGVEEFDLCDPDGWQHPPPALFPAAVPQGAAQAQDTKGE